MSAIAGIIADLPKLTISNILNSMSDALADHHNLGTSEMLTIDGAGFIKIGGSARIWKYDSMLCARAARFAAGDVLELANKLGSNETDMDDLLPRAFRRWGSEMGKAVYGDHAISIFDTQNRQLDLWRDSSGVKPLFYAQLPNKKGFAFASNINALLVLPELNSEYDMAELAKFLQRKIHMSNGPTFFKHIRTLRPGSSLRWRDNTLSETVYWRYDQIARTNLKDPRQIEEAFTLELNRAIKDRLEFDGLNGSHISGGVDSTTIALMANEQLKEGKGSLYGYTWSPPAKNGELVHELKMLDQVQRMAGIPMRYCDLDLSEVKEVYRRDIFREPTNTLFSEVNILKQAQKDGVKVMLSGWGGDEVVSSNMVYYLAGLFLGGQWAKLTREVKPFKSPEHFIKVARFIKRDVVRVFNLSSEGNRSYAALQERNASFAKEPLRSAIRSTKIKRLGLPGFRVYQHKLWENGHIFNRISDWDQQGARFGIEYRYPLIDRRLLEFTLGLPLEVIFEYPIRGSLLRKVLSKYVGTELAFSRVKLEEHRQSVFQRSLAIGLQEVIDQLSSPDELKNQLIYPKAVFDHLKKFDIMKTDIEERTEITHLLGFALSPITLTNSKD